MRTVFFFRVRTRFFFVFFRIRAIGVVAVNVEKSVNMEKIRIRAIKAIALNAEKSMNVEKYVSKLQSMWIFCRHFQFLMIFIEK